MDSLELYNGKAYIGFIDILGFSDTIKNNWNSRNENPLDRLLQLKKNAPENFNTLYKSPIPSDIPQINYKYQTFSDSFFIGFNDSNLYLYSDIVWALFSLIKQTIFIWKSAIDQGFTVRGALSYGDIYWNRDEVIGPELVNLLKLEKEAINSRIIISSNLKTQIQILEDGTSTPFLQFMARSLCEDFDNKSIINPKYFFDSIHFTKEAVKKLEEMQIRCTNDYDKSKYDSIIKLLKS